MNETGDSLAKSAVQGYDISVITDVSYVIKSRYCIFIELTRTQTALPAHPGYQHMLFQWRRQGCISRLCEVSLLQSRVTNLKFYLVRKGFSSLDNFFYSGTHIFRAHFTPISMIQAEADELLSTCSCHNSCHKGGGVSNLNQNLALNWCLTHCGYKPAR